MTTASAGRGGGLKIQRLPSDVCFISAPCLSPLWRKVLLTKITEGLPLMAEAPQGKRSPAALNVERAANLRRRERSFYENSLFFF